MRWAQHSGAHSSMEPRKGTTYLWPRHGIIMPAFSSGVLTHYHERQVGWRSLGKHWPDTESDEDDNKADKEGDVEVLSRALQRMEPLTHLALLNNAVHKEPDNFWDDGEDDVDSTLEVPSSEPL